MERRFFEFREMPNENDRVIEGVALRYGEVAELPIGRETFERGAFGDIGDVILNVQHDRSRPLARTGGGGLELIDDDELSVRAVLPQTRDADDVLELINQRVLRGLSIEFRQAKGRFAMEGGRDVLRISSAVLTGVGVVDRPAYEKSILKKRWADHLATQNRVQMRQVWL